MADSVDVVVVGMGPAGEEVAGSLAEHGLDVVGIESNLVGGECPYWGCVPSKMMIRASNLLAETGRVGGMAGSSTVTPDWGIVAGRIRNEATDNWNDQVAVERFEMRGGRFVRGHGRLAGPDVVEVDGHSVKAGRGIVLATGATSWIPNIPGLSETPYWTNREAIETPDLPQTLIIIGGGAIAVELGQAFARFGTQVTIVETASRLIPNEEPEASALLEEVFRDEGIQVVSDASVINVSHHDKSFELDIGDRGPLTGERLLVATGRRPDLSSLGVDAVGLDPSSRSLATDERIRVAPGIWAVGDLTGVGAFTHVALYQAAISVHDILGKEHSPADYRAVPRVTFTDPEIGAVGITEDEARSLGMSLRVRNRRGTQLGTGLDSQGGQRWSH